MQINTEQFKAIDIRNLSEENIGESIWIRGRVHVIRKTGNICFIILRYQTSTLQIIASKKKLGMELFKELLQVTVESIIDCLGILKRSPEKVEFTSYKDFEMDLEKWILISKSAMVPFRIDDANDFGETFRSDVKQYTKLENRWLDLRTPVNYSIFKIQSGITQLFREYLIKNNFIEIHSPKIIGSASEGGAQIFEVKYFDRSVYLAQSPQLYKQMAINSDFDKVFEIGPVFRAENAITARHMCEFIGLDIEMAISQNKTYREIQETLWNILTYIFDNLKIIFKSEIECIREKISFNDVNYPKEPLIIKFSECVNILRDDGKIQDDFEDLNTENEKRLGEIIKQKYNSDLFIIDQYPSKVRPFYTMPHPENPNYACAFDVIFRCTEISSGSQRIHDYDLLMNKVIENKIDPNTLKYYLQSFSHGSRPHGGFGLGLERVVSLFLDLGNVKLASFCPRDPKRIFP